MFTAQMMHDKTWDAYSMQDGKLVYDETKDGRFNGPDGESLKKTLSESLKQEEGGFKNGKMQRGYDNNIVNKLKLLSDDMYGSYDKGTANNLNNYWMGRAFTSFHKYLWSKVNQYTDATTFNKVRGQYVTKMVNGVRTTEWEGDINEGIFQSMRYLVMQSFKNKNVAWGDLSPVQKKNMIAFTADIATFTTLGYVFGFIARSIFGDEEEYAKKSKERQTGYARLLDYSLRDAYPLFDTRTYGILYEPFVVSSWAHDLISNFYLMVTDGNEKAGINVLRQGPTGIPYRLYETFEQFNPDLD
jgi:hypothetical protein